MLRTHSPLTASIYELSDPDMLGGDFEVSVGPLLVGPEKQTQPVVTRRLLIDHGSRARYGSATEHRSDVLLSYVGKRRGAVVNTGAVIGSNHLGSGNCATTHSRAPRSSMIDVRACIECV